MDTNYRGLLEISILKTASLFFVKKTKIASLNYLSLAIKNKERMFSHSCGQWFKYLKNLLLFRITILIKDKPIHLFSL